METVRVWVDLTERRVWTERVDERTTRLWGGEKGLALPVLLDRLRGDTDPLGAENPFVLAAGLLNGLAFHGTCRTGAYARSPLGKGIGETEMGGFFGPGLRRQGVDALVVLGRAERPAYLWVEDGTAQIRDASDLWGQETGPVLEALKGRHENPTAVMIGPAGERQVRFACLVHDLHHAGGRCGLGAVMGSKNLKAVACPAPKALPPANAPLLGDLQRLFSGWKDHPGAWGLRENGTSATLAGLNALGMLPTRNFREGIFEGAGNIDHETFKSRFLVDRGGCFACAVRCKRVAAGGDYGADPLYGGPEYETIAAFGSLCGVGRFDPILKAHELCNRLGLDTISTGMAVAWLMECVEERILSPDEAGVRGFGDEAGMLDLIGRIAAREGVGDLLAEGTERAAARVGRGSERFVLAIKGQELAMHDPRGKVGVGLGYALAAGGADHMQVPYDTLFTNPDSFGCEAVKCLGILDPMDLTGFAPGKISALTTLWNLWGALNHLGGCYFVFAPRSYFPLHKIPELVEAGTGWKTSLHELVRLGARGHGAARILNRRLGLTEADDTLPERLFQALPEGPFAGQPISREAFQEAKGLLYALQGWDDTGLPTEATRRDLGLPL